MSNKYLVSATVLLLCCRFATSLLIELTPQEAYYWNYAIHPALSYFDHPPVVAWVIAFGQFIFGKSELGVRIGGFLITLISTWLLYALGKLWFDKKAGLWAAFLFQLTPLFFVYGVLITPDVPLTLFWLMTLYLVSIAVREDRKWPWYFAGVTLGLSLLSKYAGIFLVPSALLFLVVDRSHRRWLLRKEPYLAVLIALVIFMPVIVWNLEHHWASFSFQVTDRLSQESTHRLRRFGEFLLIQLGITSPTLLTGLLLSWGIPMSLSIKARRTKWRFCFLFSLPLLGFLLVLGTRFSVKPNWTLPGYLSLLIAAYPAYRYLRLNSGARMKIAGRYFLLTCSYALPVIYTLAVLHVAFTLPFLPPHSFTSGWKELGRVADQEAATFEIEGHKKVFLLGLDTHYVAAILSFYTDGMYQVSSRDLVGRPALAFEYWPPKIDPVGLNALAIDVNAPQPEPLRRYFARVDNEVKRIPIMKAGKVVKYFYGIRCYDYLGPRLQRAS